MAANYITIGSRFTPFSYDELVRPLQEATQAHQAMQEVYDTYAENTGLIGAELDPTLDADIINNIYNPYNETLESAATTLATQGLTPSARKSLSELRRRFGKEITPIKLASDARKAARENWDKLSAADRSLMTNANPYYLGLTSYMNGRSPKTAYVSGNELYARGKEITQAMSQVMRNISSSESLALQNQYWRILQQKGFTSKEMDDFINGVITDFPELNKQMESILQSSGIYGNGFSDQDIAKAKQYIKDGMIAGMSGDTQVDYLQNQAWGLPAGNTSDTLENPYGVMTVTGGINSYRNPDLDRRYSVLEDLAYDGKGGYFTPELIDIKDKIDKNPVKDLILKDLSIIDQVEKEIGTPQEAKGYSSGLASVLANPDFVKRDANGVEISRMSYDEAKKALGDDFLEYENAKARQRHESSAFKNSVEQSYYMTNQNDYRTWVKIQNTINELIGIGELISSDDASDIELKSNIKRYLDYEKAASALEQRSLVPQFKNPSEESAYVNNLLNVAGTSLKNHQYSAVEVVDGKGNVRAITEKEAEKLLPLLQDNSKFFISGNLNPISKKGNRNSGLEVSFTGDNDNAPATFIIHEDSLDAAVRHTNRIYNHLTDFSMDKIKDPQVLSGAQYNSPDLIYNIKWSEEKDGVRTATVKDSETGEVYNYVAFVDKGSNGAPVQKVIRTTIDDVAYGRGYLSGTILQNNIISILNNLRTK